MIKTRFAPSPTGYLHIGGLRTALYNYLFAKQKKGKILLRIEDTDQSREVKGAVYALLETMQKMGLNFNEGPSLNKTLDIQEKGQNKPYFQSKRVKIYQEYAQKLILADQAYYCQCSPERLAKLRQEQEASKQAPKYDGCCRNLNPKNEKLDPNKPYVIRLKVPEKGSVIFNDLIRGEIKIDCCEIDDQVLIKSDGFATYHLANVVDDHLMGVTHVIRGEEWLPSTPKHILLYEAFNWPKPVFAHLPLLLNKDKSKLSKRQGDVAVEDYLSKGYLPEALINYVALLGWHPQDNRELFSLKDLIKHFDLKRVQKAGAIFDLEKLNWFNCHYIHQKPLKELVKLCRFFYPEVNEITLSKVLKLERERIKTLNSIDFKNHYLISLPAYQTDLLIFKKSDKQTTLKSLQLILEGLSKLKAIKWKIKNLHEILEKTVADNKLANGDVFWPARVAVSGEEKSPSPEEIMEILGKEESLNRIKKALSLITY